MATYLSQRLALLGLTSLIFTSDLQSREHSLHRGKYDCTAGLQFYWLVFNRFITYKKEHVFLHKNTKK